MPTGPARNTPKRSTQRRRRNKVDIEKATVPAEVRGPELDLPCVHKVAAQWYQSLRESGESYWYEPSDWATAVVWAHALSQHLMIRDKPPQASLLSAWTVASHDLLTTDGARRRLRLELQRHGADDPDEDAAVTALDQYRERLGG